ncbi:odorant receptor 67d-like [Musca vetustissima]|uniref:odorant receptor 67d-like n=1 Tax=Musca vetustissima TaxID=27455 RepID=UPI002AB7D05A|nr:odorant receptor 67d-like [Musca vetustissima]
MTKPIMQRFEFIRRLIRLCSAFCGADVFKLNYRVNFLTVIVFTCIYVYFACTCYTVYKNIYIDGEWTHMLKTLCMISSGLQGYAKLVNAIWNKTHLRYLMDELYEIYKDYLDKDHIDYRRCLGRCINSTVKGIRLLTFIYIMAVGCLIVMVLVYRFAFDQRIFVLQFEIPRVDINTEHGYLITNCVHSVCIMFGAFGNYAADMCFFTFVNHAVLFRDILKCKFRDLNDVLEEPADAAARCHTLIQDIFLWHQRYIRYIEVIKDNYFWVIVVEMSTVAFSIVLTLFCLILGRWPGGQTYLAYCFIMMYLYCAMGNVVEVTNTGIVEACYNEVLWYRLPLADRKMLKFMLMMGQKTDGITIGAVIPLTMATALDWTKKIYSMTMMLINFLDKD